MLNIAVLSFNQINLENPCSIFIYRLKLFDPMVSIVYSSKMNQADKLSCIRWISVAENFVFSMFEYYRILYQNNLWFYCQFEIIKSWNLFIDEIFLKSSWNLFIDLTTNFEFIYQTKIFFNYKHVLKINNLQILEKLHNLVNLDWNWFLNLTFLMKFREKLL